MQSCSTIVNIYALLSYLFIHEEEGRKSQEAKTFSLLLHLVSANTTYFFFFFCLSVLSLSLSSVVFSLFLEQITIIRLVVKYMHYFTSTITIRRCTLCIRRYLYNGEKFSLNFSQSSCCQCTFEGSSSARRFSIAWLHVQYTTHTHCTRSYNYSHFQVNLTYLPAQPSARKRTQKFQSWQKTHSLPSSQVVHFSKMTFALPLKIVRLSISPCFLPSFLIIRMTD